MITIHVQGKDISLIQVGDEIYVSLTDLTRGEEGSNHIQNWMRNRNTVEVLGIWEAMNNPNFKGIEFDTFRKEAGLNSFTLTPRKWIDATNAKGIVSKAGNQGGTYAHQDIALSFCMWLSPMFHLLVVTEFRKLKEQQNLGSKWELRRYISKVNYRLQTDAIKSVLVPLRGLPKEREGIIYAEEADLIYIAMFNFTSRQWREANPELAKKGWNIRDVANTHQLIILSNLESLNSAMINSGQTDKFERTKLLRREAINQLKALKASTDLEHQLIDSPNLAPQKAISQTDTTERQTPNINTTTFKDILGGVARTGKPDKPSDKEPPKDGTLF
jgi:hypothetical protein